MTPTAEALAFLTTEAGRVLLEEAAALPADRLTRLTLLRRRCSPEIAAVAVELLELRHRARRKFSQAETLFFTKEGWEQSSGEVIANYRAGRFPAEVPLLDACCGIGGDARSFSERMPVVAVDANPASAVCARANTAGSRFRVSVLCADVTTLDFARMRRQGVESAFFDPSRRLTDRAGERRRVVRNAEDYAPPLSFLRTLLAHFPNLGVKISPAVPDEIFHPYPDAGIEFISERGECKEAVLWFGQPALDLPETPTATVLSPEGVPAQLSATKAESVECSSPRAFLYEPDPAVIRAHAHLTLAARLNASLLAEDIAYLTADTLTETPFAPAYRVLEWMPYHIKKLQGWLRAHSARLVAIKKRGVTMTPEEVRKSLKDAGDFPVVLVLTRQANRTIALLCEPPT